MKHRERQTIFTLPITLQQRLEFHVSREARDRYSFDESLFSVHGNALFADFDAASRVAYKINTVRDVARYPERAVRAGELYAAGLIDEILHLVIATYRQRTNPDWAERAERFLRERVGAEAFEGTLKRFATEFPAVKVYRGDETPDAYLSGSTDGVPHRFVVLEELLLLWLNNENPAFEPFLELFEDEELERSTAYREVVGGLETFFEGEPALGEGGRSLFQILRAPALHSPTSLEGQLAYLRDEVAPYGRW